MALSTYIEGRRSGAEFWIERDICSPRRPFQLRRMTSRDNGEFVSVFATEIAAQSVLKRRTASVAKYR